MSFKPYNECMFKCCVSGEVKWMPCVESGVELFGEKKSFHNLRKKHTH